MLKKVVSIIRFLAERGLAFRGDNEIIGSPNNGYYLGLLKLISKYDPFIAQHIHKHANRACGHVNYLSLTICEDIISGKEDVI